jgi:hypothetical protein
VTGHSLGIIGNRAISTRGKACITSTIKTMQWLIQIHEFKKKEKAIRKKRGIGMDIMALLKSLMVGAGTEIQKVESQS